MKFTFTISLLLLLAVSSYAQSVGIATTAITPDASSILEVQSTTKGLLIPRVALTATNAAGPIVSPATSLMVYNTATAGAGATAVAPGYYYNAGTPAAPNWARLINSGRAWETIGNFGTTPATNWLGTNDAQDFATRTNNLERTRILSAGNILFNRTTAVVATDLFEAQGNATFPDAINGYTNQAAGTGVYGENNTATGAGAGAGVYGITLQTGSAGTVGDGSTVTRGVLGITTNATYAGVQGQNNDAAGDGVYGINAAATGAGGGAGVFGYSEQTSAAGVWGSGGTLTRGVLGTTNNATYAGTSGQNAHIDGDGMYAVNSAVSGAGLGTGIYARSDQSGGAGVFGVTANSGGMGTIGLCGAAAGVGNGVGVFGQTTQGGGAAAGVYGYNSHAAGAAMVAYNAAASGANSGDGIYAFTAQSVGMGVSAWNGNTNGTAIIGGGNNLTAYYLPTGSGGAFSGLYDGAYGFAIDSITNRTSYTVNAAGVYGKARFNHTANRNTFYHFGVYGEYFDNSGANNGLRSGGILGYGANNGSGAWGSLGYLSSGTVLYGGYFTSPAVYTTGAGKSMNEPSASVGFGAEGGFMGGHVNGSEYGLVVNAERAAMLIEGESYSTSYYAVLNKNDEGDYTASYATVSTSPKIYGSGTATLVNGVAVVKFDKEFGQIASSEAPVIVTVTPMGPSKGLYVSSSNNTGFTVMENASSTSETSSSVTFSWIAVASVQNQEVPEVPSELRTAAFHNNLKGFMKNESSDTDTQYFMWWDGESIRFDEPQVSSTNLIPSIPTNSKEIRQSTVDGFQMRLDNIEVENRTQSGATNATQIQKAKAVQSNTTVE